MRRTGNIERDMEQIFTWINGQSSSPIACTVAVPGTEVAVVHELGFIPAMATQVATETADGQGVIYKGTTAWTKRLAYLTATAAGDYAVTFRR